ncbi:fatty acyl CoA synthetase [Luteimonas sp. XNQY3]|nr:LolA-related protein [Luteimonas sp. XNQY3]MCD9006163.1 fatty acyl CoA synthetase [Luteimonas sp. XNQY3]
MTRATISRPRSAVCLLLAALLAVPTWAAAQTAETPRANQSRDRAPAPVTATGRSVDADWILQRLTRHGATATPFVELRTSSMLKRPLLLSGEYRRPDAGTLVREVREPYAETTTIRAGEASIAREGRNPRTFPLSRVPELAALQGSFGALLAGDRKALEAVYALEADGVPADWTLTLTPRDPRTATRVTGIVLRGRDADLRCIETRPRQGDAQPTLLGSAATSAATVDSLEAAQRLCHDVPR